MKLLNNLITLLVQGSSLTKSFLTVSVAVTALSLSACSDKSTQTQTETTCTSDQQWDSNAKKCVAKTAAEDTDQTTPTKKVKTTFVFANDDLGADVKFGANEKETSLTAYLFTDFENEDATAKAASKVELGTVKAKSKTGTEANAKTTVTFDFSAEGKFKALQEATEKTGADKTKFELTLFSGAKEKATTTAKLSGDALYYFLGKASEKDAFATGFAAASTVTEKGNLVEQLEKVDVD